MKRLLAALYIVVPLTASAQVAAPQICAASPRIATAHYPGASVIPTSNDLTRFNGKAIAAGGQRLLVQLRLRDTHCVPVSNAILELWQADPYGKWKLATAEDRVTQTPVFSGAGRTYTDNNGSAHFITVFPAAAEKNEAPRLYLRVLVPGMPAFDTILYFADDVRNDADAAYKKLDANARPRVQMAMSPLSSDPNVGFAGSVEIVLPEAAPYRTY